MAREKLSKKRSLREVIEVVEHNDSRRGKDLPINFGQFELSEEGVILEKNPYKLTPWAMRQVGSMLGVRWEKWFGKIPTSTIQQEVRLRSVSAKELVSRARVCTDENNTRHITGFVSGKYSSVPDLPILRELDKLKGTELVSVGELPRLLDPITTYQFLLKDHGVLVPSGDYEPGVQFRNSEVGASSLSVDEWWLRMLCTNGLIVSDLVGVWSSAHRGDQTLLAEATVRGLIDVIDRVASGDTLVTQSIKEVDNVALDLPLAQVFLKQKRVKEAEVEGISKLITDGTYPRTRGGFVNAITQTGRDVEDLQRRYLLERVAGMFIALSVGAIRSHRGARGRTFARPTP